jgi:hypothetical protein
VCESQHCCTQPLTDFCTYDERKMVCVSARTSVTAAQMSMAMASILKVFLMRKKDDKGYSVKQRRIGREVGQRLSELGGVRPVLCILRLGWRYDILSRSAEQLSLESASGKYSGARNTLFRGERS